jgi:hemerythrin-like metal-binding protein
MDMQHKHLFDLLNQLLDSVKSAGNKQSVKDAVEACLITHTRTHFQMEKELMRECAYSHLAEHKKIQIRPFDQVTDYRTKLLAGKNLTSMEVFNFLKAWLINHIQEEARDGYGSFLRTHNLN